MSTNLNMRTFGNSFPESFDRSNLNLVVGTFNAGIDSSLPAINDIGPETAVSLIETSVASTFLRGSPILDLSVHELAEWEGCVTDIQKEGPFFSAVLNGVKGNGVIGQEDDAVIPISDVSQFDLDLLHIGNYFRLCVLQGIDKCGDPIRYVKVIFRRMPAYRQKDLDLAKEKSLALVRGLRVE